MATDRIVKKAKGWPWQNNQEIPRELALCVQTGREENLELVTATQLPHKVNASVTGQCTELVCFRLGEPLALSRIKDAWRKS